MWCDDCSDSWLPKEALQSVSVPFCFICLLHLANEKDLLLQPTGPGVLSVSSVASSSPSAPVATVAATPDTAADPSADGDDMVIDNLDADGNPIKPTSSCSPGLGDFIIVQNANSANAASHAARVGAALQSAVKKH